MGTMEETNFVSVFVHIALVFLQLLSTIFFMTKL